MSDRSGLPLAGIRVLDFAWIGAGALVTKALAELGAEVVRIESRARPDNLRMSPPFRPGTSGLDASGYFASRNPGKLSVALDMKHPRAREVALALAARCDVLTSNFRVGVMERWQLGFDDVRAVNPSIIYLVMPMQGLDGPHRDFVGFGSTIAALAGLVHASGLPGRVPVGTGTHYPDHVPNPGHALVALLAAIIHQRRTGEGQLVELSQLESTVNVVGPGVLHASLGGSSDAAGNRTPLASPRNVYRCRADRRVALACWTDEHWSGLAKVLDRPEWLDTDEFASGLGRVRAAAQLDRLVEQQTIEWDRDELVSRLREVGVPAGAVNDARDVLQDEQLAQREFWYEVDHDVIGAIPMFHLPFRFAGQPRHRTSPPPLLGQHTHEVMTRVLEMSETEYQELLDDGVFH